jgi:hypothetical protein
MTGHARYELGRLDLRDVAMRVAANGKMTLVPPAAASTRVVSCTLDRDKVDQL